MDAIGDEGESGWGIDIELPREEVGKGSVLFEDIGVEVLDDGIGERLGVKSGPESNATSEDIGVGFVFISRLIEANARGDIAPSNVFSDIRATQPLVNFTIFAILVQSHESATHKYI